MGAQDFTVSSMHQVCVRYYASWVLLLKECKKTKAPAMPGDHYTIKVSDIINDDITVDRTLAAYLEIAQSRYVIPGLLVLASFLLVLIRHKKINSFLGHCRNRQCARKFERHEMST